MLVKLLFPDRNAQFPEKPDPDFGDRAEDLRLEPILNAMSQGDPVIYQVSQQLLNQPLTSEDVILYRQAILQEAIEKPQIIEAIYNICQQAEEQRKATWYRLTSPHLTTVYSSGTDLLKIYLEALIHIRRLLETENFHSQGLNQLSQLLKKELSEDYLDRVRSLRYGVDHPDGLLISAGFGPYLQGVSYVQRQPERGLSRVRWLLQPSYTLADRDMKGSKDLELRQDRAIQQVARVMAQAASGLQRFADQLRMEIAFYIGAVRLHNKIRQLGLPLAFPKLAKENSRSYQGLYDGSLALQSQTAVVGNSVSASEKDLWLITGANQGGKTTFLRSVGLCQLMAQCGLFIFGEGCTLPLNSQIFTHFCRKEDRSLTSGKLDEELRRMTAIIDRIRPRALLLSNESFSSTNDRDGSALFQDITLALLKSGVQVFSVTHLIGYARYFASRPGTLSLRPERKPDGERTYRLLQAQPTGEAYAQDIWDQVFT